MRRRVVFLAWTSFATVAMGGASASWLAEDPAGDVAWTAGYGAADPPVDPEWRWRDYLDLVGLGLARDGEDLVVTMQNVEGFPAPEAEAALLGELTSHRILFKVPGTESYGVVELISVVPRSDQAGGPALRNAHVCSVATVEDGECEYYDSQDLAVQVVEGVVSVRVPLDALEAFFDVVIDPDASLEELRAHGFQDVASIYPCCTFWTGPVDWIPDQGVLPSFSIRAQQVSGAAPGPVPAPEAAAPGFAGLLAVGAALAATAWRSRR